MEGDHAHESAFVSFNRSRAHVSATHTCTYTPRARLSHGVGDKHWAPRISGPRGRVVDPGTPGTSGPIQGSGWGPHAGTCTPAQAAVVEHGRAKGLPGNARPDVHLKSSQ